MSDNRKIGIIDSGIGGLTVAREIRELLPKEDIIYLGDNKNVPYGNKSEDEIYILAKKMIDFLIERDVKLIAVACNTISSILVSRFSDYDIPIVSIIEPVSDYVYGKNLQAVGVMATRFTIRSKTYERLLHKKDKELQVITESCPNLAAMIDSGDYGKEGISDIINNHMENILGKSPLKDIILGCTHYPILLDKFTSAYPHINFINPAYEQTHFIEKLLEQLNIKNDKDISTFEIFTTGNKDIYLKVTASLYIKRPDFIHEIKSF